MSILRRIGAIAAFGIPLHVYGASYTCASFDYPPLVQKEAERPAGLAVEIVESVFRNMGHSLSIKMYPVARSLEMAKAGLADCIFAVSRSDEYAPFLEYTSQSIVPQVVYFYARKGSVATFNGDISSIKRFRIGVARKLHYGPRFEQVRSDLILDEAPTIESNFKKLLAGRVDLVPSNWLTASSALSSAPLCKSAKKIIRVPIPVESFPTYIAFSKSKNLASLRRQFDQTLAQFLISPQYRELVSKYGMDGSPQPDARTAHMGSCMSK